MSRRFRREAPCSKTGWHRDERVSLPEKSSRWLPVGSDLVTGALAVWHQAHASPTTASNAVS